MTDPAPPPELPEDFVHAYPATAFFLTYTHRRVRADLERLARASRQKDEAP